MKGLLFLFFFILLVLSSCTEEVEVTKSDVVVKNDTIGLVKTDPLQVKGSANKDTLHLADDTGSDTINDSPQRKQTTAAIVNTKDKPAFAPKVVYGGTDTSQLVIDNSLDADSIQFKSLFDGTLTSKSTVSMASLNDLLMDDKRLDKLLNRYKVKEKKLDVNVKVGLLLQMMLLDAMLETDATAALDSICLLTSLKGLDLRGYSIEKLPECFSDLQDLEVLILDDDKLTEFPMQLLELKNLRYLAYRGNGLTNVPDDIYRLDNLEYLYLGENKIKELPSSIVGLKKLVALDIHKNPFKGHVSLDLVCAFNDLTFLSMSYTGLKELPACIGQLKNLERLMVNDNELKALPKEIAHLDRLKTISLDNKYLDLDQALRVLAGCDSLERMSFIKADIDSIPGSIAMLKNLRSLRFYDCGLKYIPKEIGQLRNLTYLGISKNYLGYLEPAIFDLVNLETLSTSANSLDSIPTDIARLNKLKRLMVKDNYLTDEQVEELEKLLPKCEIVY